MLEGALEGKDLVISENLNLKIVNYKATYEIESVNNLPIHFLKMFQEVISDQLALSARSASDSLQSFLKTLQMVQHICNLRMVLLSQSLG